MPFPAYHAHPAAPTNLIRHHAADLNLPVACGDVAVYPGDIMVGDGEGVAVIPRHIADEVAEEAFEQTIFEDFVQEQIEAGRGLFGVYPPRPRRARSSSAGARRRAAERSRHARRSDGHRRGRRSRPQAQRPRL